MLILVALIVCAALVAGCGEDDDPPAAPAGLAELTVEVEPGGKRATVRCEAAQDSELCRAVGAMKADVFEPTPRNVACTQQYGGPETAKVTGTFRGEPVDAEFARRNGCEIARWEDAMELLEAAR
jgi:hypothetical protein